MNVGLTLKISRIVSGFLTVCVFFNWSPLQVARAQTTPIVVQSAPVIPGTGVAVKKVGDDFEDVNWKFNHYFPKSSKNLDKRERSPGGESANDRWYEGIKRGQPDVIRRVPTPAGGLAGSQGSLLLQSLQTGIPGKNTYQQQQDDFICNIHYLLGGAIPISQTPNVVVRVYLPPLNQWENRIGCHFAFRSSCVADAYKRPKTPFGGRRERELYWPGFFLDLESREVSGVKQRYATWRIRANRIGNDFNGLEVHEMGWWTLGMSVTPDGRFHYYAKPGIENLTKDDYITSQLPYGFRALQFRTFFFNVCNGDDGRNWSTAWIIDDPTLFYVPVKNPVTPPPPATPRGRR